MPNIIIDQSRCTRCNTCARVCLMFRIKKATDTEFPSVHDTGKNPCMMCGQCEAYCPQQALTLDYLVDEKIRVTPEDLVMDSRKLALYMKARRSVRHFTEQPVPKELISEVLEVARYAASGGNGQPVKWLVIHDPAETHRIAGLTVDWMRSIRNTTHPLAGYVGGIPTLWDRGADPVCRNAPHLVFAHTPVMPSGYPIDAIIALTHFDIAAPAFGIGATWAGFVMMAMSAAYQPLLDALPVPEGRKIAYGLMFGFPQDKVTAIPRRKSLDINWI